MQPQIHADERRYGSISGEAPKQTTIACEASVSVIQTDPNPSAFICVHLRLLIPDHAARGFHRFRRLALAITVTELKDMAIAASKGDSRMPKNGYRTPRAMGRPRPL